MAPSRALEAIWRFVGTANRFIDQTQPWAMAKAKDPALGHTLWTLQASLWVIARFIAPVLPATAATLRGWLGDTSELRWPEPAEGRGLGGVPALTAGAPSPLFPRLDDAAQAKIFARIVAESAQAPAPASATALAAPAPTPAKLASPAAAASPAPTAAITFDEFSRLELRVGRVLSAAAVPKAKKLLHLSVDLGEAQPRSIVAGIAEAYAPDKLVGKQVIVVANLAPALIRGIRSEGMILAAGDEAILGLSALDSDVPPGTRVR
jgi:methionyl-tRNA synthetase